jgi:hypothetical protein
MTLEEEMIEKASVQMAREIDREILWGMLKEIGWTRVMLDRLQDNKHAIDITYWLEANCKFAFERNGRDFIFESKQDATLFILRWV